MPPTSFQVGPYVCMPLSEARSGAFHVGSAVVRRQIESNTCEARLVFREEAFETPEEAMAYAAARTDFLLRFEARAVVPF